MKSLIMPVKYIALALAALLIVSIFQGVSQGVSFLGERIFGDNAANTVGELQSYTVTDNIKHIEIEGDAVDFKIVTGKAFSVETNLDGIVFFENNGTLTVKAKDYSENDNVTVCINIPSGTVFNEVSVELGAGDIYIEELSCQHLELEVGACDTVINSLYVSGEADINGGAGDITINDGEISNLELKIGVGNLELKSELKGESNMEFGVGNANITLLGEKSDYSFEISKGIGELLVDGVAINEDSDYGSGKSKVEIDSGIGDTKILFE